jgi:NADH:ubiquinone oxidoreductase subunit K
VTPVLLLAAAMFCAGLYGVLTQRNGIGLLISLELMVNAVNVNLVAFARMTGTAAGQSFALFVIAITVAEVVVGLAILLLLSRSRGDVDLDLAQDFQG